VVWLGWWSTISSRLSSCWLEMYILFSFVGGVGGVSIAGSDLDLFGNTSFEKVDDDTMHFYFWFGCSFCQSWICPMIRFDVSEPLRFRPYASTKLLSGSMR